MLKKIISDSKRMFIINISIVLLLAVLKLHGQGTRVRVDGTIDKSWSTFDFLDLMYAVISFIITLGGNFILGCALGVVTAHKTESLTLKNSIILFIIFCISLMPEMEWINSLYMINIIVGQAIVGYLLGYAITVFMRKRRE